MKTLYRFRWDCGRMGSVEGLFVAEDSEIQAAIGKDVTFGEILGKHSDVGGKLEDEDLEVLTTDQDFIEKALKYRMLPIGYNPLHYLTEKT